MHPHPETMLQLAQERLAHYRHQAALERLIQQLATSRHTRPVAPKPLAAQGPTCCLQGA